MDKVTVVIQLILVCMFAASAAMKALRTKTMVRHWNEYRYPMWFMGLVAILEAAGVLGMIAAFFMPQVRIYAAFLLASLMLGAIHAHLIRANHKPFMATNALIMLALSIIVISR